MANPDANGKWCDPSIEKGREWDGTQHNVPVLVESQKNTEDPCHKPFFFNVMCPEALGLTSLP
jgi:hypothetical protein